MSTHIKIENQTEVPVLVALFEQPKCNDHPTRSAVLKPGESCDWGSGSVPLGNYQCYAVMSGDAFASSAIKAAAIEDSFFLFKKIIGSFSLVYRKTSTT